MIQYGGDVSNFSSPLTAEQLAFAEANWSFVVIGLQDAGRARDFQRQFANLKRMYYIERPTRDLTIPEPGAMVWLDLEPGCLVTVGEVQQAMEACEAKGLPYGIYGNETSIVPVIGNSTGLANLPYWWANYGTPDLSRFKPHNGWTKPTIMQYSSEGVAGINCDLNIMEVEDVADVKENYDGEANSRRAWALLCNMAMKDEPEIKVSYDPQGRGLVVTGKDGQGALVACDVPWWAAAS